MPYAEGRIFHDADSHLMETQDWLISYILNGQIVRRERDNIGRPKYVIEGTALDGRGLTAVVQPFQSRQLIVIVTVYET